MGECDKYRAIELNYRPDQNIEGDSGVPIWNIFIIALWLRYFYRNRASKFDNYSGLILTDSILFASPTVPCKFPNPSAHPIV